tara:strand:- start:8836 stop:9549 length:714 start_codon:yes stop_codon:yes gene_type:complete
LKKTLLGLILVSVLFISACEQVGFLGVSEECEAQAKKLFPKDIVLYYDDIRGFDHVNSFEWADGTVGYRSSAFSATVYGCLLYTGKGENRNYCHTEPVFEAPGHFKYSKQVTNEEGIILGYNEFTVQFIVDTSKTTNKRGANPIVDYNLKSCKWVNIDNLKIEEPYKIAKAEYAWTQPNDEQVEEFCSDICRPSGLQKYANNVNHNFFECGCRDGSSYDIDYQTKEEISKEEREKKG